jgi:hypothetical protein
MDRPMTKPLIRLPPGARLVPAPLVLPAPFAATDPTSLISTGGPLPMPSPWTIQGPYIQYSGGVVIGSPVGANMGAGSCNAQTLYINGQSIASAPFVTESLTVTATNTLTQLSQTPAGTGFFFLIVNEKTYTLADPTPAFSLSGQTVTWMGPPNINPGDEVVASYGTQYAPGTPPPGAAYPSPLTPRMDGTVAIGVDAGFSRGDHVHPSDTTKAPLASPAFTGTPTAPTATPGNTTTQLATTQFVANAIGNASSLGVQSFNTRTGAVTLQAGDVTNVGGALTASPAFTGSPTAPTATAGTDTAQLATTAFVTNAIAASTVGVSSWNTRTGAVILQTSDVTNVGGALNNSPAFTGTPTAPTPIVGDNSMNIATTAFVETSVGNLSGIYVRWVPYTGPPQSFSPRDMTRDGDWTMIANKSTSDRPAPQETGAEEDLLPAWTPTQQNARATYTLYNEWTLNQGGWINQYGVDALAQNVGAAHAVTLTVNGTTRDTFSYTPNAAGQFLQDITPIVATSGTVLRVTLQVTQVANNLMYWEQQTGLFATAPTYCSLAVGSKDGAAAGTTAYGCHLMFIPGAASPDWDIVAYGGSAAGGGGGGGGGGIPDAPSDGNLYGRQNAAWSVVSVTAGVSSWNTRTGAVTLTLADVTGAGGAPLANPTFTGVPAAPTATAGTNTTQLATTAFVTNAVAVSTVGVSSFNTRTGAVTLQSADVTGVGGALLASPAFTGTPTAPTATAGTTTTQLATTAFVAAAVSGSVAGVSSWNTRTGAVTMTLTDITNVGGAPVASPAFTGTPTATTPAAADNSTNIATTAFVTTALAAFAPLASPALTGSPTAPTATVGTSTTQLATTAFVQTAVSHPATIAPLMDGAAAVGTSLLYARQDHVHPTDTSRAPIASPTFTGVPAAPTPAPGNSTTQLATTAFVATSFAPLASPAFSGTPIAPTATAGTNSTQIATTAFVVGSFAPISSVPSPANVAPLMDGAAAVGTSLLYARQDHVHPSDTSRAPLASPAFTGVPIAPTATAGTNTTQLATTAFVATNFAPTSAIPGPATVAPLMDGAAAVGTGTTYARVDHVHPSDTSRAPIASPTFTGTPIAPTAIAGTSTNQIATTAFVAGFAPLASPTFTGTPQAPTPPAADSSTTLATTAFVATSFAPLASPTFTGTPSAPTATAGTSTTQIASTAFVAAAVASPPSAIGDIVLTTKGNPTGGGQTWLACDGSIYANSTYPSLQALLGNKWATLGTFTAATITASAAVHGLIYDAKDSLFIIVGAVSTAGDIETSPDGIVWTRRYSTASRGMYYCAVGSAAVMALDSSGYNTYSTNGTTWTEGTQVVNGGNGIAVIGTTFVTFTTAGAVYYTTNNGLIWTAATSTLSSASAGGIAASPSLFVMMGSSVPVTSNYQTSPDGVNWTLRTGPWPAGGSIFYFGGYFIALSKWISTDGINWTAFSVPVGAGSTFAFVGFLNPLFIYQDTAYTYYTADFKVWHQTALQSSTTIPSGVKPGFASNPAGVAVALGGSPGPPAYGAFASTASQFQVPAFTSLPAYIRAV